MRQAILAVGRLMAVSAIAFGGASILNWFNHNGYWNGTIFRVQTTDFNILSHTLPTKLSYALLRNDVEELQETLDSNYGLFGIIVTNCRTLEEVCLDQQILFSTNSNLRWKQELSPTTLSQAPYDLLRNPPPLFAEGGFENSRDQTWNRTNEINDGEIIGRVYYVRGVPPAFWSDYGSWLKGMPSSLFSDSGAKKYYSLTSFLFLLGGFAFWSYIERLLHGKRNQKYIAQEEKRKLIGELWKLKQQLQERLGQVSDLINQREMFAWEISNYRRQQDARTQDLKSTIALLKNQLLEQTQQKEGSVYTVKQQEQIILELQKQLQITQQQASDLHKQLEESDRSIANLNYSRQQDQKALKLLEEQISETSKELEQQDLNGFERAVLSCLQSSRKYQDGSWIVLSQLDVSQSNRHRQYADFIVIGKSCVFVIEAKYCLGRIEPEGDPRNTIWSCITEMDNSRTIGSSGKRNPHEQVSSYCDSVRSRVERRQAGGKISVYGIVVFPDETDITQVGRSELTRFSRVTLLGRLVQVIQDIEASFVSRYRDELSSLSPEQIEDLLCFRRIRTLP